MNQDMDPAVKAQIDKVIEEHIRPILFSHGGDMEVLSFDEGVLKFKLTGQCAGCPAADLTSEEIIKAELCDRVDAVKDAVLVQTVSEDLINEAKRILRERHGE